MRHIDDGIPPQNYERSLWIDTADTTDYPALDRSLTAFRELAMQSTQLLSCVVEPRTRVCRDSTQASALVR